MRNQMIGAMMLMFFTIGAIFSCVTINWDTGTYTVDSSGCAG